MNADSQLEIGHHDRCMCVDYRHLKRCHCETKVAEETVNVTLNVTSGLKFPNGWECEWYETVDVQLGFDGC